MSYIREILLAAEEDKMDEFAEGCDYEKAMYHMRLLAEAGLIEGLATLDGFDFERMTWAGHEFLDSIRSDSVWEQTVVEINKVGGSVALETLKAVAAAVAVKLMG